jgi:hypothetical protein
VTKLKIDGTLGTSANDALSPHAGALYATPGARRLIVGELKHTERVMPAPDEDTEPSCKLRITSLEVANEKQEDALRQVLRVLHLHRTAYGTLTEDQDLELSESTLEDAAGALNAIEAARLHVAIDRWTEYGRRVLSNPKATASEVRREFDTVIKGLEAVMRNGGYEMPAPPSNGRKRTTTATSK